MSRRISRRSVLAAGVGLATFGLPKIGRTQPKSRFSFLYFSDTHVGLERNFSENADLLAEAASLSPDFALNGGDVTDYGWPGEFERYEQIRSACAFPIYEIPGNHDVRWSPGGIRLFRERLGPAHRFFEHEGCGFLLLDTTTPLSHWGHVEKSQLEWARDTLDALDPAKPFFVLGHHWLGRPDVMIDDELALFEAIDRPNLVAVLTGHGHSDLLWDTFGVPCFMNKGLYQGSYTVVEVDREARQVRFSRRTDTEKTPQLIHTASLENSRRQPRLKLEIPSIASQGRFAAEGAASYRWDRGEWKPVAGGTVPLEPRISGYHRIWLSSAQGAEPGAAISSRQVLVRDPSGKLERRWRIALPGGAMSHLRISKGKVYVSLLDGSLVCVDATAGKKLWSKKLSGYCHSTPLLLEDRVAVGSSDGDFAAFDPQTGREIWKQNLATPVYSGATMAGGRLVLAPSDGTIRGFEPATGGEVWRYEMPPSNTAFSQSVAASDGTRAFVGAWDNAVYGIDGRTGELRWRTLCCPTTFAYSPAIGSPCYADGSVFVPANGNSLFRIHGRSGRIVWEGHAQPDKYGHSSPAYRDGRVFAAGLGDAGLVYCVDALSGQEIWRAATGSVMYDSSAALGDGWLAIGSVDSLLSVIRLSNGEMVDQTKLAEGHFLSTPVASGDMLFAATFDNHLTAFRVQQISAEKK